ncbi:50S ribosomal protein L44e [Candidatus Pacearchaeota archaeon CG10_big_fil_rev_8_21_14_0_10_30_48]|nr:MAG: 50S ribosomal protein L44e [Candidatus Pacearchaeota archaeon CG10_big_fil_rev_8_21_14_0_10_30_48]
MKKPKITNRFCPTCKKKSEHKVKLVSTGKKKSSLTRGSIPRAKKRGGVPGMGNKGRYGSKPPIKKWKRITKNTKKHAFVYTCQVCKKSHQSKKGIRASKMLLE